MNSDQLIKFKKIVDCGSMIKAADSLYMTQSALSHSLSALETELGCSLFIREKKKLVLSNAGARLLPFAEIIDNTLNQAIEAMNSKDQLRISATNVCAAFLLNHYPEKLLNNVTLIQAKEAEMPELLRKGELDVITCDSYYMKKYSGNMDVSAIKIYKNLICREQLGLLVPKGHKYYDKKFVTYEELENEPLCIRLEYSSLNEWIENIDEMVGFKFRIEFSMDRYSYEMLRERIPYPEIRSINSVYNPDFMDGVGNDKYKFVRIDGPYTNRYMYMWYLDINKNKVAPLLDSLTAFYSIEGKKFQTSRVEKSNLHNV